MLLKFDTHPKRQTTGLSGKRGVRNAVSGVRSVENAECGKFGVLKKKKLKRKVISPHVGITPNITPSRPMTPVQTSEKHNTLNEMKK